MYGAELLLSNHKPVRTNHIKFYDAFKDILKDADELYISVGYVSAESLAELKRLAELNGIRYLCLTIGMHGIDKKFTRSQYDAAMMLNKFLRENNCGEVRIVTSFRYHGKIYLAGKNSEIFAGIIGSDNLNSIVDERTNIYEASVFIREKQLLADIKSFTDSLNEHASVLIDEYIVNDFYKNSSDLASQEGVERSDTPEAIGINLTGLSFEIPIKTKPKSGLNAYFGAGRIKQNGVMLPRHWYEAELIVPKTIILSDGYPKKGTDSELFHVITDDGYKFMCEVSGNYGKNFRSKGDLKILGRWMKGRMEDAGVLKVGELVTEKVLDDYGRNTFTLIQTSKPNLWYIDFGVRK